MEKILLFLIDFFEEFSLDRFVQVHRCVTYFRESEKCLTNQMIDDILIIVLL